jgi:hypothetical protein
MQLFLYDHKHMHDDDHWTKRRNILEMVIKKYTGLTQKLVMGCYSIYETGGQTLLFVHG